MPTSANSLVAAAVASQNDPGARLARFDQRALIQLQDRLERDSDALFAGETTIEEIDKDFEGWALLIWGALATFTAGVFTSVPGLVSSQSQNIDQAIDAARLSYRSAVTAQLGQAQQVSVLPGELDTSRKVQAGAVRPTFTALGGGATSADAALLGSPSAGQIFANWLSENGLSTDGKIWIYGPGNRRPFTGHLQLNGLVFNNWSDDLLAVSPQDAWIRRPHYRPGDHTGCQCVVSPYIPDWK